MSKRSKLKKVSRKQLLYSLILLGLIIIGVWFQLQYGYRWGLLRAKVLTSNNQQSEFVLKVVSTPPERAKGLMFVKSMPKDEGMLFVYPDEYIRNFWMKDTFISLDIIFLNKERKIVNILENVPVLSTESRSSVAPAQYVIELNAGTAREKNIKVGDQITFSGQIPRGVPDPVQ